MLVTSKSILELDGIAIDIRVRSVLLALDIATAFLIGKYDGSYEG